MLLPTGSPAPARIRRYLETFSRWKGQSLFSQLAPATKVQSLTLGPVEVPRYQNEFWTSRQRQAASIHEISYRACFKPQLPHFFIELLTEPGQTVYDPFCGRGTTPIEAALLGRRVLANDINPLSEILARPRLSIPSQQEVAERLGLIRTVEGATAKLDLSMFFHRRTEAEIVSLRIYLMQRRASGQEDDTDRWIRMVATNRLTGHSKGFFSVYTLPPNQAVSPERQRQINTRLNQMPQYRNTREIILRKTRSLLSRLTPAQVQALRDAGRTAVFLTRDARHTPEIPSGSVHLTVTSPPFLDVVQYPEDNWLRCWFNGIDQDKVASSVTMVRSLSRWEHFMGETLVELYRVTAPGGWVAFEVGDIKSGNLKLDEVVVPLGVSAGFSCIGVVVNSQRFTKTSNIWGVENQCKGTNTNRIVLFHKEG